MPRSAWPRLRTLSVLLFIAALSSASRAADRSLKASLDWTAPESASCPTASDMIRAVESRLRRTVFVESSKADVELTVSIERSGREWAARLELLDADRNTLGSRALRSASHDCAALKDVLPVVVALLVDASRQHVQLALPQPTYVPTTPTPAAPKPLQQQAAHATRAPPARDRSLELGWVASAEGQYGLLPGAAPGGKLTGIIDSRTLHASFELWLAALSSSDDRKALWLSLFAAGTGVCRGLWRDRLHWRGCAGAGIGSLRGIGRGFEVNLSTGSLHVDARASTQLDLPIARPWFLRLEAGLVFPLVRPRFLGEMEPGVRVLVHRPAVIVPQLAVGFGVGFL